MIARSSAGRVVYIRLGAGRLLELAASLLLTGKRLLLRALSAIYSAKASAPSSPICLSEVIHKPFTLSRVFLLSSGGKSIVLVKKKAPSRSSFSISMHVVLKTRHVNPISTYVDLSSTYVVQTYLPLVRNFYPYAEQQLSIGYFTELYRYSSARVLIYLL